MGLTVVSGDIFATQAQTAALGLNAAGRLPAEPVFTHLQDRYPVFVSEFRRQGRAGRLRPGSVWFWREGTPWLAAFIVRETPQGPPRPRYIEAALLYLYHHGRREGLRSLALLPLVDALDWPMFEDLVRQYAPLIAVPLVLYRAYEPGTAAEASEVPPSGEA